MLVGVAVTVARSIRQPMTKLGRHVMGKPTLLVDGDDDEIPDGKVVMAMRDQHAAIGMLHDRAA